MEHSHLKIGGQTLVNYIALVPYGYDERKGKRSIAVKNKIQGGHFISVSEKVRVTIETDATATIFPNCVSTDTGRWIPKKWVFKNPKSDDLLIIKVKLKKSSKT